VDLGSGTTLGPDLASIEMASDNEDLDDDEVRFIFDEDLDTSGASPDEFALIYAACAPATLPDGGLNLVLVDPDQDGEGWDDPIDLGVSCLIMPDSVDMDVDDFGDRSVIATFATDAIDNKFLVGAQVSEDAGVLEEDAVLSNLNDEVQYSTAPDLFDDGETTGPQLIGATLTTDTNVFGEFTSYVATFTFDADLDDDVALAGDLKYWFQDGEDVLNDTFDDCDFDDDTLVVCEIDDEDSEVADAVLFSIEYGTVTGADSFDVDETAELGDVFVNPEASIEVALAAE
jgi:hypothetical protein